MPSEIMDLVKQAGQLFMVGFDGWDVNDEITHLIRDCGVGSIVLFQRNVSDAKQLRRLTGDLQRIAKDGGHQRPLFIAIDQEGGLVTRIKPPVLAQMPGAMTLGASDQTWPDAAKEVSTATAQALKRFEINMNLAPLGDVNSEPKNPVIGVRSPGDDPYMVGEVSSTIAKALENQGICPVIKHFPGHGDTAVDSHYGLPVIEKSMVDFERCELIPFKKSIENGIDAIMTAHISIPALDAQGLPASLSAKAIELLRKQHKFEGLLMSDCLEMDGVRTSFGTVKAAEMALVAGTDCLMICHTHGIQEKAIRNIAEQLRNGTVPTERFHEALRRTAALKDKYLHWNEAVETEVNLASMNADHEVIARRAYDSAVTLVRDKTGLLPIHKSASVSFLYPGEKDIVAGGAVECGEIKTRTPWTPPSVSDVLKTYVKVMEFVRYDEDYEPSSIELDRFKSKRAVILVTRNATQSPYQHELGLRLSNELRNLIVIATCGPYDFLEDEDVGTYLTTYEPTVEAFQSAVKIVFGDLRATGKLPVRYGI